MTHAIVQKIPPQNNNSRSRLYNKLQGEEKAANAVQLKTQYSYTSRVHRLPIQPG